MATQPSTATTTSTIPASGSAPGANTTGGSGPGVSSTRGPTFSVRTCLELIPGLTDQQVEFEFKYLQTQDSSFTSKATKPKTKRDALLKYFNKSLYTEIDNTVDQFSSLLKSFSCAVETAVTAVRDITNGALDTISDAKAAAAAATSGSQADGNQIPTSSPQNSQIPGITDNPVSLCDIDLSGITIDSLLKELTFDTEHPGGRQTTFFGSIPYSYGKYTHPAAQYPTSTNFDKIF